MQNALIIIIGVKIGQHDSPNPMCLSYPKMRLGFFFFFYGKREKKLWCEKKDHKIHQIFILSFEHNPNILSSVLNAVQMLVLFKYRSFSANHSKLDTIFIKLLAILMKW